MSGWRSLAYRATRPLLFRFEPERIHRLTLHGLRFAGGNPLGRGVLGLAGGVPRQSPPGPELLGLRFRNRIGVGAGFDKDGVALRGWAALGLGFAEVGTVTPQAQAGNPRPRLFRLAEDEALVNRMGFNNAGAAALSRTVMLARRHLPPGFVVGANIGRGAGTAAEAANADYLEAYRMVAPVADYVAVNVSSPNTPGLRDLQQPERLVVLLRALAETADEIGCSRPLLVKIAPDLGPEGIDPLLDAIAGSAARGLILGNTTIARGPLRSPLGAEAGGLSGVPLRDSMLAMVQRARTAVGADLAIVASGGIGSTDDVRDAYDAGADLVQLWTGLVYRGPGLIGEAVAVARDGPVTMPAI